MVLLLQQFDYAEGARSEAFHKDILTMEASLQQLEEREQKYSAELDKALKEYVWVKVQAARRFNPVKLYETRQAVMDEYENGVRKKSKQVFGLKYSLIKWMEAKRETCYLLREDAEEREVLMLFRKCQRARQKGTAQVPEKKCTDHER